MRGELIPQIKPKAAKREAELKLLAERQIVPGEQVEFGAVFGKQHIMITDRRIVISAAGSFLGERTESIPLGAITGVATTMKDDKLALIQLAVPGRTWGELVINGEDLRPVHTALIRCLPVHRRPEQ